MQYYVNHQLPTYFDSISMFKYNNIYHCDSNQNDMIICKYIIINAQRHTYFINLNIVKTLNVYFC